MDKEKIFYLANIAEEYQRFLPQSNHTWIYKDQGTAGAFLFNGKTTISTNFWAIEFNEKLDFLNHIEVKYYYGITNYLNVYVKNDKGFDKPFAKNNQFVNIYGSIFVTQFIKDIVDAMDEPVQYSILSSPLHFEKVRTFVYIESPSAKAIVFPILNGHDDFMM